MKPAQNREVCCNKQTWEKFVILRALWHQTRTSREQGLLSWLWSYFGLIFAVFPFLFWNGDVYPVPSHVGNMGLLFYSEFTKITVERAHESQEILRNFKQYRDYDRLWEVLKLYCKGQRISKEWYPWLWGLLCPACTKHSCLIPYEGRGDTENGKPWAYEGAGIWRNHSNHVGW